MKNQIRHKFVTEWEEGGIQLELEEWVNTLSEQEKEEFYLAQKRQLALRKKAIDEGKMYIEKDGSYVWKDSNIAKQGKEWDDVWLDYWNRWLKETKAKFYIREEKC